MYQRGTAFIYFTLLIIGEFIVSGLLYFIIYHIYVTNICYNIVFLLVNSESLLEPSEESLAFELRQHSYYSFTVCPVSHD